MRPRRTWAQVSHLLGNRDGLRGDPAMNPVGLLPADAPGISSARSPRHGGKSSGFVDRWICALERQPQLAFQFPMLVAFSTDVSQRGCPVDIQSGKAVGP